MLVSVLSRFLTRSSVKRLVVGTSEILLVLMLVSGQPGTAADLVLKLIPEPDRGPGPERYTLRVALECRHSPQPASLQWSLEYSSSDVTVAQVAMSHPSQEAAKNVYCSNGNGQSTCLLFGLNQNQLSCGHLATIHLQAGPNTTAPLQVKLGKATAASASGSARRVKADSRTITFTH